MEIAFIKAADSWENLHNQLDIATTKLRDMKKDPKKYPEQILAAESALMDKVKTLNPVLVEKDDKANFNKLKSLIAA